MKRWKRIVALLLAVCCACSYNITAFATTESTYVNVQFIANGGTFDASQADANDPTSVRVFEEDQTDWGLGCTVGLAAKYCNQGGEIFDLTDLKWDANESRAFAGWKLYLQTEDGRTPVSDTLYTTQEALDMVFDSSVTRVFIAQWAGDDDDYYSQIYIRGYMDYEFEVTESWLENGQTKSNVYTTSSWGDYLREGSAINDNRSNTLSISKEPSRTDADFEGWLEFKVFESAEGDTYELVSDTVYTTSQVIAKAVPEYDVAYVAKWSDIPLENYFYHGEMFNVNFEASDGLVNFEEINGTIDSSEYCGIDFIPGSAIGAKFKDISATYWNPDRALKGWILCAWREVTDEDGNTWENIVQIDDKIYTSEELLDYEVTEHDITFRAVWEGEDSDYYSYVYINGYGAEFTFNDLQEEDGNQIKEERKEEVLCTYLRETPDSFADQTADNFEFVAEPERMDNPNAKFEGWLKFKVNEWDEKEDCELIDATLYTTADMLNSKVPEYDVMYVAKWSDIPLSYYFYQGEMYRVYFEAMNGTLHYEKYSGDSDDLDAYGLDVIPETTIGEQLKELTATYWDPDRALKGWVPCAWREVTDEEGNTWMDLVEIEDKLYTSAEVLAYEVTEDEITFRAVWEGEDSDYYSYVEILGYNGEFKVHDIYYEEDKLVKEERSTDMWSDTLKETVDGIQDQAADYFEFVSEPERADNPDAKFEGWVEFKRIESEYSIRYELVSDTLLTTAQMLTKEIPEYDVAYVAKWSDIPLDSYFAAEEESPQLMITFNSNGGNIKLEYPGENGKTLEEWVDIYGVENYDGLNVKESLELERTTIASIKKENATLLGWKVYLYEEIFSTEIEAGSEPNFGDPDHIIFYSHTYADEDGKEWDVYISLVGGEVYSENLSTKDLYALETDRSVYAMANWVDAPVLVKAASYSYNKIKITWEASENVEGYMVYRKLPGGKSWIKIKELAGNDETSYIDTTAVTGTTYYYTVRAYYTKDGVKTASAYDKVGLSATAVPNKSAITAVENKMPGDITISWKKISGASGYRIYRINDDGSYTRIAQVANGSILSYTETGLTVGETYRYRVRAYHTEKGTPVFGAYSAMVSVDCSNKDVPAPELVKVASYSYNKIKVTWNPVDGADGYRVYRKTEGGSWKSLKVIYDGATSSYIDATAATGTTYAYSVKAFHRDGNKPYWSILDQTGMSAKAVPNKVTITEVSNSAAGKVKLTWNKVNGASGYRIYRITEEGKYERIKQISSGSTLTHTISGLKKGTAYTYRIRAYRTVDGTPVFGAYSAAKTVTVKK